MEQSFGGADLDADLPLEHKWVETEADRADLKEPLRSKFQPGQNAVLWIKTNAAKVCGIALIGANVEEEDFL